MVLDFLANSQLHGDEREDLQLQHALTVRGVASGFRLCMLRLGVYGTSTVHFSPASQVFERSRAGGRR
jgi:hypothetical protein